MNKDFHKSELKVVITKSTQLMTANLAVDMARCFWITNQKVHKLSKYHKNTQVNGVKLLPQIAFLKLHHKWQKNTTLKRILNPTQTNSVRKNLSSDSKRIEKPQGDKSSLRHIQSQTKNH